MPSAAPGNRFVVPALVVVALALVGATVLVLQAGAHVAPVVPVTAAEASYATAPGHAVDFALVAPNPGAGNRTLHVAVASSGGLNATVPDVLHVPGSSTAVAYVHVVVPASATTGNRTIQVTITGPVTTQHVTLQLAVAPPTTPIAAGATVLLTYTARLESGAVFATNDPVVGNLSFPTASFFRPAGTNQPVPVSTASSGGLFPPLREAILGLGVGQSASVTLTPAQGYGNATTSTTFPRIETLNRTLVLQRVYAGPRQNFGALVNASTRAGDVVHAPLSGMTLPFVVEAINASQVRLAMDVHAGDAFTEVPAWPGGTQVEIVGNTSVTFLRSPGTATGVPFTYHAGWSNATVVTAVTSSTITLRSSPAVGTNFTRAGGEGATSYTVSALTPTNIVATTPNPSPLAGQTTVFDVTVRGTQ